MLLMGWSRVKTKELEARASSSWFPQDRHGGVNPYCPIAIFRD